MCPNYLRDSATFILTFTHYVIGISQILVEVDLHQRYTELVKQLEDCIAFLLFFLSSSARMSGDTKLSVFITEAMLVSPATWAEVTSSSIDKEVCLKHLKSLVTGLDERQHGGEFYKLKSQYKEKLSPEQIEQLRVCVPHSDNTPLLLDTLREMIAMLSSGPLATNPDLKSNLYNVGDGYDLSTMRWFTQYFPESISIRAVYHTYVALKSLS